MDSVDHRDHPRLHLCTLRHSDDSWCEKPRPLPNGALLGLPGMRSSFSVRPRPIQNICEYTDTEILGGKNLMQLPLQL